MYLGLGPWGQIFKNVVVIRGGLLSYGKRWGHVFWPSAISTIDCVDSEAKAPQFHEV